MKKKEEKKLQTEFNITEDNFDFYHDLLCIKSDKYVYSTRKSTVISMGVGTVASMIALASTIGIVALINPESALVSLMGGCIDLGLVLSISSWCYKINKKISLDDFKKKYPNINTDVDVESLEKELTKYKELKTVSKDMEEKKEYFSTLHSEEYNQMTTEEKMDSLNKEIEYLGQVMVEEKYENNSTKDSAKVLKKTYNPNNK